MENKSFISWFLSRKCAFHWIVQMVCGCLFILIGSPVVALVYGWQFLFVPLITGLVLIAYSYWDYVLGDGSRFKSRE